jgi:hypothetical protein
MRYDWKLRGRYSALLVAIPIIAALAGFVAWAIMGLTLEAIVLTLAVPGTPIVVWTLREYFRHRDAASAQKTVKVAAEALLVGIKERSDADCALKAREFQDAIFIRRAASPLILPGFYQLVRDKMEEQMNKGAEERLREAGY